ncbi:AsmA family protein [Rhodobacteraceae bacterium M382]|nr:AsmA family protein [Rhodobacteraceae bacterium M382]
MRLLVRIVFALVAAIAVVIGALLVLPGEKIAAIAADQVETQTGRKLEFDGKVAISLWPVLGVRTGPVRFANADWAGVEAPRMLTAQRVNIGVSAPDLLSGNIRIKTIDVVEPVLHLSTRADGQGNWVFDTQAVAGDVTGETAAEGQPSELPLAVENITLRSASLTYAAFGAAPIVQTDVDLDLLWPDPQGTADVKLTLRPAGAPVQIEAEVGTFAGFLSGDVASVGATVRTEGGRARFDGRASIAGNAAGRLTVEAQKLAQAMQALGLGDPEFPQGAGQRFVLGTDMTFTTDGRLSLRDMVAKLDENELTGAADILTSGVPNVTAQLKAQHLDLSAWAAPDAGAAIGTDGPPTQTTGWPTDKLDASALELMNGTIDLTVGSLDLGTTQLGASKLTLGMDRARAVLTMAPMAIFGGTVTGQLIVNNRNGLSVGGKLNAADIALNQALTQLADVNSINGQALAQLEFLGVGESVDAIMKSLSGKGWFEVGKGFFTGFDLEELMRSGQGNGGSTVFDTLTASFSIQGGNLSNQDLLLRLKGYRAEGTGRIGLGDQDLDYLFTPIAVNANAGKGLRIPVRIKGSWWDPSIRPDLSEALEADIEAKKDELEAKAKAKAIEKLEAELETTITEDQDLEELLKDQLEDKAKKSLLKLLGAD